MPIYRGFSQAGQGVVAGIVYGLPPLGLDGQLAVKQGLLSGDTDWMTLDVTLSGLIQGTGSMLADGSVDIVTSEDTFPYEDSLGNPTTTGYVLSSTTTGTRSWIEMVAGGGTSGSTSEYCPGYTYTYIGASTFSIEDFDVENLFSVSRRIKFTVDSATVYGTINAVDYDTTTANDTTITMTMEDSAVLTAGLTEVCFVAGTAGWSPVADSSFAGTSINSITSGVIGATHYTVAVGDGGKLAYSTDYGVTWTQVTTGTSENFNSISYSNTHEQFLAVGDVNVMFHTTNMTSWTLDTTTMAAYNAGGTGNITSVVWWEDQNRWALAYQLYSTGNQRIHCLDTL